jgi:L-cysteine:1D-myo-inositol 2-amino-2-deoxy-alpha-D-glucopyranoside ligase
VLSWNRPEVPRLAGRGALPRLHDTATGELRATDPRPLATIYVCGITPYDATHIGHASTYLAYDTLIRLWLDAGLEVLYVQNATDVDDPLLERAAATGVDWRDLAAGQLELFREDMAALRVIPPDHYVAVTEVIPQVSVAVERLLDAGYAYRVDDDVYFDIDAASERSPWHLGQVSLLDRDEMLRLSAERGGDPGRAGKRDPLDPALWRAARPGEPSWPSALGAGRPGWHIECSVIAHELLPLPLTVNGGGIDLAFPHHELTAAHTAALTGDNHARLYSHAALVGFRGAKMSKSLGNLVFVSELRSAGVDPRAIRLAILDHHYRAGWEWTDDVLAAATVRLAAWTTWAASTSDAVDASLTDALRATLAHDLDTPVAVQLVDERVASGTPPHADDLAAINALLGIQL